MKKLKCPNNISAIQKIAKTNPLATVLFLIFISTIFIILSKSKETMTPFIITLIIKYELLKNSLVFKNIIGRCKQINKSNNTITSIFMKLSKELNSDFFLNIIALQFN